MTSGIRKEVYDEQGKERNLNFFYGKYNTKEHEGLTADQLQVMYERLRDTVLSIPQIKASMKHVCCGYPEVLECDEDELLDLLDEMDRRYFLAKDLQWEFNMLDRNGKGSISKADVMFLFQMVYGDFFSKERFDMLMNSRAVSDCDVTFQEIEVELCNIPTYQLIEEIELAEEKRKEIEAMELAKLKAIEEAEERKKRENAEKETRRREAEQRRLEEEKQKVEELMRIEKVRKKQAEEKQQKEEEERKRQEEDERKRQEEEGRKRWEEEERKRQEEEERKRQEEENRVHEEKEMKAREEERLAKEEEERLEAERRESESQQSEEEDKKVKRQRALKNWKKVRTIGLKMLLPQDLQALRDMKARREKEEAIKEEDAAEDVALAEENAENELKQAERLLKQAATEEERKKAKDAKERARRDALENREKRLRLQLRAAVKVRIRPKIDIVVDEAKETKIQALNPDIKVAEEVSDSLKCGEELENAMINRNLSQIEEAIRKIKKKSYEKQHVVRMLEAEKLADKLQRLEKSKRDILALDQRTIAEIRSYTKPKNAIREVMIATYMILGYKEKELNEWKFILALLGRTGKESLKRMCTTLDASKMDLEVAKVAERRYLNKHTLESTTDLSAGIGTFYVWSTAMIEEARNWHEDSEFRKKVEEKRKAEMEEANKLKKKRNNGKSK